MSCRGDAALLTGLIRKPVSDARQYQVEPVQHSVVVEPWHDLVLDVARLQVARQLVRGEK